MLQHEKLTKKKPQVRRKDDKIEMLQHEREFLWHLRRTTGQEIQKAREDIKNTITEMKIKSKYGPEVGFY